MHANKQTLGFYIKQKPLLLPHLVPTFRIHINRLYDEVEVTN